MSVQTVNRSDFERHINDKNLLVDFYADWCGPCRALAPTLDAFDQQRADVTVVKVNVDQEPQLAAEYGVRSIPTLIAFAGSRETARHTGMANATDLANLVAH